MDGDFAPARCVEKDTRSWFAGDRRRPPGRESQAVCPGTWFAVVQGMHGAPPPNMSLTPTAPANPVDQGRGWESEEQVEAETRVLVFGGGTQLGRHRVLRALGEVDHPEIHLDVRDESNAHAGVDVLLVLGSHADAGIEQYPALPTIVIVDPESGQTGQRRGIREHWRQRGATECLFTDELSATVLGLALRAAVLASELTTARADEPSQSSATDRDPLTGFKTKPAFLRSLQLAIDCQNSGATPYSVLLIDIDRCSQVAESLGLEAADQLIAAISQRLARVLSPRDTAARVEGKRFAIIVGSDDGGKRSMELSSRIRTELADPFIIAEESLTVTAKMGVTSGERNYSVPSSVMRDALAAMSRAGERGNAELFRSAYRSEAIERFRMESALSRALAEDQLRLHYQPIVTLGSGRVLGFEALLRWEHPQLGQVPPYKFIPVAEESGSILEIGRWVMEEAARQLRTWDEEFELRGGAMVSVNVSGRQVAESNLVQEVERVIARTGIDPQCLKVELTETVLMADAEHVAGVIQSLRNMGVQVWIDDFGTGYSSLRYLQRFPISGLKIDKSFVDPLDGTGEGSAMARAILNLAESIGVEVIAEGIEEGHQAKELISLGCDRGQGYLYSKPVSVAEAYALLARR